MNTARVLTNLSLLVVMLATAYFYLDMTWILDPFLGVWNALRGLAAQ